VTLFNDTFQAVLDALKGINDASGNPLYEVRWRILDALEMGGAQSRRRLYIIGIMRMHIAEPFNWPTAVPQKLLTDCFDMTDVVPGKRRYPPAEQKTANKNVRCITDKLKSLGIDARRHALLIDTDGSKPSYSLLKAGTVTATRASNCGWWIPLLNRRIKIEEVLQLQGFKVSDIDTNAVSERQLGHIVGNAFSQDVVRRLLTCLLPAAGLVAAATLK
jgi:site-specific DNA-cytosine methylase